MLTFELCAKDHCDFLIQLQFCKKQFHDSQDNLYKINKDYF